MKNVRIEPVGKNLALKTSSNVVEALLAAGNGRVKQVCGGKGLCATCHIKVVSGERGLTPLTARERTRLATITGADATSRLACQAQVIAEGVVIDVPPGIYLRSLADLETLIGRRADEPLRHPVSGQVLVPVGKIITRSVVASLKDVDFDIVATLEKSETAI